MSRGVHGPRMGRMTARRIGPARNRVGRVNKTRVGVPARDWMYIMNGSRVDVPAGGWRARVTADAGGSVLRGSGEGISSSNVRDDSSSGNAEKHQSEKR